MRTPVTFGLLVVLASAAGPLREAPAGRWKEMRLPDPRLHIVAVGVDESRLHLPLELACADAEAFSKALQDIAKPVYTEVFPEFLTNPSREDVLAMVRRQVRRQEEQDTFVFFFAGNEYVTRDGQGAAQYRLVLRSTLAPEAIAALDREGFDTALTTASLSMRELHALLARMPAANQLVVLDTCHSSLGLDALAVQESALSLLERGGVERNVAYLGVTGMALELRDVTHGGLTYTLLQGLGGEADQLMGDTFAPGTLTARELEAWCYVKYPRVLREHSGAVASFPRTWFQGGDFPLGRLREAPAAGATTRMRGTDVEGPSIELIDPVPTRGPMVRTTRKDVELKLRVRDPSHVHDVHVQGRPATARVDAKGEILWVAKVPLGIGQQDVRVEARDTAYNRSDRTWIIERRPEGATAKPAGRTGTDYALLIGINDYEHWSDLANPILDVGTIAEVLREAYGFETEVVENPGKTELLTKLRDYVGRSFDPDDQLLVFIAGHGHHEEQLAQSWVIPRGARRGDENGETYVPHQLVVNWVDRIPCEHVLLMLDVCFGGAFFEKGGTRSERGALYARVGDLEFIRRKLERRSRKWITSGGKEYVPDGENRGHSPFAFRLLEILRISAEGEPKVLTFDGLRSHLENIRPMPHAGRFGRDEPASSFLFIPKHMRSR